MYIELHAASAFSFLQGASLPETLVDCAAALGYPALALLDRDGVYGAPRFHNAAKKAGLKAIIGAELTMEAGFGLRASGFENVKSMACGREGAIATEPAERRDAVTRERAAQDASASVQRAGVGHAPLKNAGEAGHWILPVLVESQAGYRNLCQLITRMKLRAPKGEGALALDELEGYTSGLIALAGRELTAAGRYGVGGLLDRLIGLFGRSSVYVELQRHLLRVQDRDNQILRDLADAFHVPIVATNGVRFAAPAERPLYDTLTCIHHKTDLANAGRRLTHNAERYLKAPEEMAALFVDLPEAARATRDLADRLEYTMANLGYEFPRYPVPPGESMMSFLRKITDIGARDRYRPYEDRARAQIARELDLIEKLDLAGYFLIVWDIVNYCRQHDILVQGRGSAANSAVCYSLGITAVDPVGMDLLFERFLSEERGEWPDIDLDLPSGDRREAVIQHVYEKYGKRGAAMTANVITYRGRSAAREVGKALGLDAAQVDTLAKVMNNFEFVDPGETLAGHLRDVGFELQHPTVRLFTDLWQRMQDLPRHLGQHSGGMVICQGQLDAVVPLENASMPGRVVIQWDKDDCAEMGLIKVDLLGLGMMAVLQDALAIVNTRVGSQAAVGSRQSALGSTQDESESWACGREGATATEPAEPPSLGRRVASYGAHGEAIDAARGSLEPRRASAASRAAVNNVGPHAPVKMLTEPVDLAHLPPDDPVVYDMLQKADTIGVFQVESRAQMATLPRLKPACFYDIVVQVAIIRPGPIVGEMVHPYLNRRAGREPVVYPHPSLEPILERTLGVPLFQEQLLRMAMVAAGFSGGQAEELRRAFGFKRSEKRMRQVEVQLREGMAKQGITGEAAAQIIQSITSFALYGFPESHAASFALLAYASAYLKAHYSSAFYAALLNNQPMGFYHPATLVKDAQRRGVRFAPIDVQYSDWFCTIEEDGSVRLGLMYVTGLREEVGRAIAAASNAGAVSAARRAPGSELRASRSVTDGPRPSARGRSCCPKCGCEDESMIETVTQDQYSRSLFCNTCAHDWREFTAARGRPRRFASLDDLVERVKLRREEMQMLAEIGALNSFGYHRREALWQAERAVRPAGELFEDGLRAPGSGLREPIESFDDGPRAPDPEPRASNPEPEARGPAEPCPLHPMTEHERLLADYAGTGMTIGPHPMAMRRANLATRGVLRAVDLPRARHGRRVRVAGTVITRQRPGTAKGFVFLTLEDETGISNVIIRPDLFAAQRTAIIKEPFLLVEGILQTQDGVTSVKAERVEPLPGSEIDIESHDFH